jgi:hypothetical protein
MQNTSFGRQSTKGSWLSIGLLLLGSLAGCSAGAADPASETDSATSSGAAPVASSSEALSSYEADYEYYSDATYSKLVGVWFRNCDGKVYMQGRKSKFVEGSRIDCYGGPTVGCWEIINGSEYCGEASCISC